MSCRSTPAGSAWTTFARLESGLSDVQTLSAFHALRAEGEGVPAPTQEEWNRFVAAQRIEMEAAGFTEARVRSVGGRMERAAEQLPDGRSWYALRNIRDRSVTEANRVAGEIAHLATVSGASVEELTTRYEERLRTVERGRSVDTPAGYTEARTSWRQAGLPADHGTFSVLTQMRTEANAARDDQTPPRRVEHVAFPNSAAIYSAGYDPTDGRLEVIFRRRSRGTGETEGTSRTYAYHSVPASVWAEMNVPGGNPGVAYNQNVRNHSEYKYESVEAEEAAATARCEDCGQWRAAAHTCPQVERTDAPGFTPDPVVVSTSRDGRTRLVSVSPEIVEAQQQAAVAAAEAEVVEAFEAYAGDTSDEATAAAAARLFEAASRITLADRINGRDNELTQAERDFLDAEDASRAADLADQYYDNGGDDYYGASKPGLGTSTAASTTSLLAGLATSAPPTTAEEVADRDAVIADLRARLTGTGTASARVAAVAPEPTPAEDLGMRITPVGRFEHVSGNERRAMAQEDGRYDNVNLPTSMGDLVRAANTRPVVIAARWQGERRVPNSTGGLVTQRFVVTGEVTYSRQGLTPSVTGRDLQCNCPDYRNDYDCMHVREAVQVYAATIESHSAGIGRGINASDTALPEGARTANEAGVPIRGEGRFHRRTANLGGGGDLMNVAPRVADLRAAAAQAPVIIDVDWSGNRNTDINGDDFPAGRFQVTGQMIYSRPNSREHVFTSRDLRCNCPRYREDYTCPHVEAAVEVHRARIAPAVGSRGARATQAPLTEADIARAQNAAQEALRADWTRQEATNAEARARHAAADPADSYSNNFEAFENDHAAALARKAAGEQVIPFATSNALGGQFTRESGRGFGVELEFDFPAGVNKYAALRAIGRDLYAAGLTRTQSQTYYHAGASAGYVDTHERGWSFEEDCTVAGEIVSPIMYDEPETWENIAKICEIVKRHGGVANAKTGSHVHVSSPSMTTQAATELMQLANSHEDIMYRISQNPESTTHRPMRWCGPNNDVPQGGYTQMHQVASIGSTHGYGMNLAGVNGRNSDHPEVRYWDGTLDAAAIQAQVKVSCGLILAAERNAGQPRQHTTRETVGSHHNRLQAVRGRSRRALTSAELAEDTTTFRSFVDTLFTRREDKAQVTALFASTKWQAPQR